MKKTPLNAQKRVIIGNKVKNLRKKNLIPANIFGKKIKSLSISVSEDDFAKVYQIAGETGLVELTIDGEIRPVLIKLVQVHPVTNKPLHIDFYQVDLNEKVSANVPLKIIGISPAIATNLGILLQLTNEVEVEALPADLPENIEVDISVLAAVGDTILVSGLVLPKGVVVITDKETEVAKIGELITKQAEAEAAKAEAEKAAAQSAQAEEQAAQTEAAKTQATEEKAPPTPAKQPAK